MAEPFKNLINAALVRDAATQLALHTADFDAKAFVKRATAGPDALELKARTLHICAALEATMPRDFGAAATAFKGWQMELPPLGEVSLSKRHSLRPITTRRYHAGRHVVAVQVNGGVVAEAVFDLRLPPE